MQQSHPSSWDTLRHFLLRLCGVNLVMRPGKNSSTATIGPAAWSRVTSGRADLWPWILTCSFCVSLWSTGQQNCQPGLIDEAKRRSKWSTNRQGGPSGFLSVMFSDKCFHSLVCDHSQNALLLPTHLITQFLLSESRCLPPTELVCSLWDWCKELWASWCHFSLTLRLTPLKEVDCWSTWATL